MKDNAKKLVEVIKEQAELSLLDAAEFFPFGAYINLAGDIVPLAAYIEDDDDQPPSAQLTEILESYLNDNIGKYQIGAIAVDVLVYKGDIKVDALRVQFFYSSGEQDTFFYRYVIGEGNVDFTELTV